MIEYIYEQEMFIDVLPAAIVSPPRLNRKRPMSLFTANGSIGMGLGTVPVPERLSPRKVSSISADVPLVKTLRSCSARTQSHPRKDHTAGSFWSQNLWRDQGLQPASRSSQGRLESDETVQPNKLFPSITPLRAHRVAHTEAPLVIGS
jgi:hypothetical protein